MGRDGRLEVGTALAQAGAGGRVEVAGEGEVGGGGLHRAAQGEGFLVLGVAASVGACQLRCLCACSTSGAQQTAGIVSRDLLEGKKRYSGWDGAGARCH